MPTRDTSTDEDYTIAFDAAGRRVDSSSPEAYEIESYSQGRHLVGIGPAHPDWPSSNPA